MLDTKFPRILGDIGNERSFKSFVLYDRIDQAIVSRVVRRQPLDSSMRKKFINSAKRLEEKGAKVIGTSCGFLAPEQQSIQASVNIPVITSALILMPLLRRTFGQTAKIGVLTFDGDTLQSDYFRDCLDANAVVKGLNRSGELYQCIHQDKDVLDQKAALAETMDIASACLIEHPDIKVFLIECTNISPYKQDIRDGFGLPVFDLVDALEWVSASTA